MRNSSSKWSVLLLGTADVSVTMPITDLFSFCLVKVCGGEEKIQ